MQHWLDKLIDLAALRGDESVLKDALIDLAQQAGFSGYAYLYIRPGHTIASPVEGGASVLRPGSGFRDPLWSHGSHPSGQRIDFHVHARF